MLPVYIAMFLVGTFLVTVISSHPSTGRIALVHANLYIAVIGFFGAVHAIWAMYQ